jgi:hypothetical protein
MFLMTGFLNCGSGDETLSSGLSNRDHGCLFFTLDIGLCDLLSSARTMKFFQPFFIRIQNPVYFLFSAGWIGWRFSFYGPVHGMITLATWVFVTYLFDHFLGRKEETNG